MFLPPHFRLRLLVVLVLAFFLWMMFIYTLSVSSHLPLKRSDEFDGYLPEVKSNILVEPVTKKTITITVFYECLCPDSKSFFLNQLLPTVEKLEPYLWTSLVPYGKAKTIQLDSGKLEFFCQHGDLECEGNKVHACVIAKVSDTLLQTKVTSCMIRDNYSPLEIGHSCCALYNINWEPISKCSTGPEGAQLLKEHGKRTDAIRPKISFIPTILVNNDQDKQSALLKNLLKEICKILESQVGVIPDPCTN